MCEDKRRRIVASTELVWRDCGVGFTLHLGRSKPLLSVVPDATYSGMWRISHRGRLSDMVNLTRAKDAGLSWALGDLNRGQESPSGASYARLSENPTSAPGNAA
jgi:hypothetical protein